MARMNRPAPVEVCYKNMRFLITHNPTNATLNTFIEVSQVGGFEGLGVDNVKSVYVELHELHPLRQPFPTWMEEAKPAWNAVCSSVLCRWRRFPKSRSSPQVICAFQDDCGLSIFAPARFLLCLPSFTPAPLPLALPRKRRGAINSKQLTYLEKYRPKQRLRFRDPQNHKNKCCIM
ncbi:protein tyrosine phosphatase type IVA 3-like [Varanus komodoensis]|uniref:protein tyrosine phosphatase type IVA 3-like n=1 Tax=Varanus komodoensis TaxID=61221 RepID=UPI001CF7A75B|nr:protein tyrosine phosphatase type IVA 3-like [Varanus komodoensis]